MYELFPKELAWYESLFKDVKDEVIVGESSTNYTKLPICNGVVQKIWEFNPDARFIYLMRNPIGRSISHYWHGVKYGDERDDALTAIKQKPEYTCFSDYAAQLEPYIEQFGREKIYTLTFEKFISNTDDELRSLFDWLGVDSDVVIENTESAHNALPKSFKKVKGRGLLHDFRHSFIWNMISPLVPKKITSAAAKLTVEDSKKSVEKDAEVENYLLPMFAVKVKNLENLLDKKFDEWKF